MALTERNQGVDIIQLSGVNHLPPNFQPISESDAHNPFVARFQVLERIAITAKERILNSNSYRHKDDPEIERFKDDVVLVAAGVLAEDQSHARSAQLGLGPNRDSIYASVFVPVSSALDKPLSGITLRDLISKKFEDESGHVDPSLVASYFDFAARAVLMDKPDMSEDERIRQVREDFSKDLVDSTFALRNTVGALACLEDGEFNDAKRLDPEVSKKASQMVSSMKKMMGVFRNTLMQPENEGFRELSEIVLRYLRYEHETKMIMVNMLVGSSVHDLANLYRKAERHVENGIEQDTYQELIYQIDQAIQGSHDLHDSKTKILSSYQLDEMLPPQIQPTLVADAETIASKASEITNLTLKKEFTIPSGMIGIEGFDLENDLTAVISNTGDTFTIFLGDPEQNTTLRLILRVNSSEKQIFDWLALPLPETRPDQKALALAITESVIDNIINQLKSHQKKISDETSKDEDVQQNSTPQSHAPFRNNGQRKHEENRFFAINITSKSQDQLSTLSQEELKDVQKIFEALRNGQIGAHNNGHAVIYSGNIEIEIDTQKNGYNVTKVNRVTDR